MKRRTIAIILSGLLVAALFAGCGDSGASSASSKAESAPAATEEKTEEKSEPAAPAATEEKSEPAAEPAATEEKSEPAAEPAGTETASGMPEFKQGDWVVGLSNSYYGNSWRKQMVDTFTAAAEEAKANGWIKDYSIQNGDNTVNAQIAQINSFILQGVDIICINAASETALNDAITEAIDAGIIVFAFDSIVSQEDAYTLDYDFFGMQAETAQYVVDLLGGKGNVAVVRGVSGSAPEINMYNGTMSVLDQYPDIKVVTEIPGECDETTTQTEWLKVIDSLPDIDAVLCQSGEAIGTYNAFKQAGRDIPIITGDNTSEFIKWWNEQPDDYDTISASSTPGCGSAALWIALYILNGENVPKHMTADCLFVTKEDAATTYKDLEPGLYASPNFTAEYCWNEIISKQ